MRRRVLGWGRRAEHRSLASASAGDLAMFALAPRQVRPRSGNVQGKCTEVRPTAGNAPGYAGACSVTPIRTRFGAACGLEKALPVAPRVAESRRGFARARESVAGPYQAASDSESPRVLPVRGPRRRGPPGRKPRHWHGPPAGSDSLSLRRTCQWDHWHARLKGEGCRRGLPVECRTRTER